MKDALRAPMPINPWPKEKALASNKQGNYEPGEMSGCQNPRLRAWLLCQYTRRRQSLGSEHDHDQFRCAGASRATQRPVASACGGLLGCSTRREGKRGEKRVLKQPGREERS